MRDPRCASAPGALLRAGQGVVLRALPWAGFLATAWLGCGGDGASEGKGGDRGGQCASICEKRENCVDIDESDCKEYCEDLRAFDPEYYAASANCYADSTCSELVDLEDCITDALRQKDASTAQSDFSAAYAAKANDCADVDEEDVADDCSDKFGKLAAVGYLDGLAKCMTKECTAVAKCILDVADDFNVDGSDSGGVTFYPPWQSEWSSADGGQRNDGGPASGDGDSPGSCDSCLATSCANELAICSGNPSCSAIADCITPCSTEGCVEDCVAQHPDGAQDLTTFTSCASERCPACAE